MKQKWITTDINSLDNYPDGINQIYQGELDGIHVKQVFSREEMQQAQEQLRQQKASIPNLVHSQGYGELIGAVVLNTTDFGEYFDKANTLRNCYRESFEPEYETTLENVLNKLGGGREVAVAHQNGDTYSPAQVRFTYPDRGGIGLHKGNEFIYMQGFEGLHQIVKLQDCLSYFLVMDKPESGGELILYDDLPEELTVSKQELDLKSYQQRHYDPDTGDLVIFHGACIWHAVAEVKGNKIRQTIGGFVGISHNNDAIYYWS